MARIDLGEEEAQNVMKRVAEELEEEFGAELQAGCGGCFRG